MSKFRHSSAALGRAISSDHLNVLKNVQKNVYVIDFSNGFSDADGENVLLIVSPYVHQNFRKICSCKRSFERYQDRTKERLRGCSGERSFKWSLERYKKRSK